MTAERGEGGGGREGPGPAEGGGPVWAGSSGGPAARARRRGFIPLAFFLLLLAHLGTGAFFLADKAPGTDAAWTGFPLDDAWIHMVYSRSIAERGVPCYNDGELENGFTSPLWMILGAIPHLAERLFGLPAVAGVKALGFLFGWLASVTLMLLLLGAGCRPAAAVLGGFLLAALPAFAFAEASGMEVALAAFLMAAALAAFGRGRLLCAGFLGGFAVLARPEAVVLFLFLPLFFVVLRWAGRRGWGGAAAERVLDDDSPGRGRVPGKGSPPSPKEAVFPPAPAGLGKTPWNVSLPAGLARLVLPGLVMMGVWVAYSLAVTGRPLPNTFYAKFGGGGLFSLDTLSRLVTEGTHAASPWVMVLFGLFTLAGLARMARLRERRLFAFGIALFGAGLLYAVWATRDMPPGCTRFFYWRRYLVPVLPFLLVPAAFGLDALIGAGRGASLQRLAARGLGWAAAAALFCGLMLGMAPAADQYAWNCQNINEVQVDLGRWVDRNLPRGCIIAVNDAGALRYFGRRRTLDLMCLNRHEGLDEMDRGAAFPMVPLPGKIRWLFDRKADYLVVFPCWFPDVDMAAQSRKAFRAAGPGPPVAGRFEIIQERRSPHFTVTASPPPGKIGQDVMRVYSFVCNRLFATGS